MKAALLGLAHILIGGDLSSNSQAGVRFPIDL